MDLAGQFRGTGHEAATAYSSGRTPPPATSRARSERSGSDDRSRLNNPGGAGSPVGVTLTFISTPRVRENPLHAFADSFLPRRIGNERPAHPVDTESGTVGTARVVDESAQARDERSAAGRSTGGSRILLDGVSQGHGQGPHGHLDQPRTDRQNHDYARLPGVLVGWLAGTKPGVQPALLRVGKPTDRRLRALPSNPAES